MVSSTEASGGDVQDIVLIQAVKQFGKGVVDGVERLFDGVFRVLDVAALHRLLAEFPVGGDELQRRGQVVVEKTPDFRQLLRPLLHTGKDFADNGFELLELLRDIFFRNGVVGFAAL